MNHQGKVVPRGGSIWKWRAIRVACASLAILAGVFLVAPGLYLLGLSVLLGGVLDVFSGIRFGPPTPSDVANDARNAAEVAGMSREAIGLIGLGVVIIAMSLVGARWSRSRARDAAIRSPGGSPLE
jgi:hypothetical protein